MFAQLPNLISLKPISMSSVIVLQAGAREHPNVLVVFTAAGVIDGLDGCVATRYQSQRSLGASLDPLAGKLLLISIYALLVMPGAISFWPLELSSEWLALDKAISVVIVMVALATLPSGIGMRYRGSGVKLARLES